MEVLYWLYSDVQDSLHSLSFFPSLSVSLYLRFSHCSVSFILDQNPVHGMVHLCLQAMHELNLKPELLNLFWNTCEASIDCRKLKSCCSFKMRCRTHRSLTCIDPWAAVYGMYVCASGPVTPKLFYCFHQLSLLSSKLENWFSTLDRHCYGTRLRSTSVVFPSEPPYSSLANFQSWARMRWRDGTILHLLQSVSLNSRLVPMTESSLALTSSGKFFKPSESVS